MKKDHSVFFKIMGLSETKGTTNIKSEYPDIEMIACLNKKKYIESESSNKSMCQSVVEVQNKQITPKLINMNQQKRAEYPKMSRKKIEGVHEAESQKSFEPIFGEHWKNKYRTQKNKYPKKLSKEIKSFEGREVKDIFLKNRKGSISSSK